MRRHQQQWGPPTSRVGPSLGGVANAQEPPKQSSAPRLGQFDDASESEESQFEDAPMDATAIPVRTSHPPVVLGSTTNNRNPMLGSMHSRNVDGSRISADPAPSNRTVEPAAAMAAISMQERHDAMETARATQSRMASSAALLGSHHGRQPMLGNTFGLPEVAYRVSAIFIVGAHCSSSIVLFQ